MSTTTSALLLLVWKEVWKEADLPSQREKLGNGAGLSAGLRGSLEIGRAVSVLSNIPHGQ